MGSKFNVRYDPYKRNQRTSIGPISEGNVKRIQLKRVRSTSSDVIKTMRCLQMSPPQLKVQGTPRGDTSPVLRVTPVYRTYSRKLTSESRCERCSAYLKTAVGRPVEKFPPKRCPLISDVVSGLRLVDLGYVLEQFERITRHSILCVTGNMRVISEELEGLKSFIVFRCDACGKEEVLQTQKKRMNPTSDITPVARTGNAPSMVQICGQVTIQPSVVETPLNAARMPQRLSHVIFSSRNVCQTSGVQQWSSPTFCEPYGLEMVEVEEEREFEDNDAILEIPQDPLLIVKGKV